MEGLFDNLEGRSDSQNFVPLTSTLRFSQCIYFYPKFFSYCFIPNLKNNVILMNHESYFQEKDSLLLNRFQFSKINKLLPNSAIYL